MRQLVQQNIFGLRFSILLSFDLQFLQTVGANSGNGMIGDLEKAHGTVQSPDTKGFQAGIYGPAQSGFQLLMRKGQDDNRHH